MSQLKELLPISNNKIGDEEVNAISAKDLHTFLEVGRDFSTWIKNRIAKYEFVENQDFVLVPQNGGIKNSVGSHGGDRRSVDYFISLDMAKEIAMVERNEKGKLARKYFIECEKQLKQVLTTENQLILNTVLANTVEERMLAMSEYRAVIVQPLLEFKEEATPKVNYHDKVLNSPDLMNISEIAKDYKLSAVKLNKILQEEGVQYKDKKGEWALYAEYKDKGYASTKTQIIKNGEHELIKVHLKWTQSGRLFIYELLKTKGITPICEQEASDAQ